MVKREEELEGTEDSGEKSSHMDVKLEKKLPSEIFMGRAKAHCLQLLTFSSLKLQRL